MSVHLVLEEPELNCDIKLLRSIDLASKEASCRLQRFYCAPRRTYKASIPHPADSAL